MSSLRIAFGAVAMACSMQPFAQEPGAPLSASQSQTSIVSPTIGVSATVTGGTQTTQVHNHVSRDDAARLPNRVRTVPNVEAPTIGATAPCLVPYSAGVSFLGGGFSAGRGVEDKACTRREYARLLFQFGAAEQAIRLLCNEPEVADAFGDACGDRPATALVPSHARHGMQER